MMNNMFGNIQYIMSEYNAFCQNPVQWLSQRNIQNPQQMIQNPQRAVQSMMGNGAMNNNQFNQIMSMAQMMQNMPNIPRFPF